MSRLGQIRSDDLVVEDIDAIEDALIQFAADVVWCVLVVAHRARQQCAEVVELFEHQVTVRGVACDEGFGFGAGCTDPRLFSLQMVESDRVGVERLHEALALTREVGKFTLRRGLRPILIGQQRVHVIENKTAHGRELPLRHRDGRPVVLDQLFQEMGLGGLESAAVLEPLTTEAIEVVVERAHSVAGLLKGQRLATVAAVQTALEVVRMDARLLATLPPSLTDLLGTGEQLLADQCLVLARILDTLESHDAHVIAVLEDGVDVRECDRSAETTGLRQGHDAVLLEFVTNHCRRPFAGDVVLEDPRHPMSALRIENYRPDFASFRCPHPTVEVAKRCSVNRAAALRLLQHPFARFGREVAAVELGDRTHDAVDEHAARRLVDVLGHTDELSARLSERQVDLDVIDAVARQAIDLVHDHRRDAVIRDVLQHALQLRTISGPGAFARVHKLFDDLHAEAFGLA